MSDKCQFNASVAKLQHEMWKNRVITFLNGGPVPMATGYKECALGKWLYEEGCLQEYYALPEMRKLEQQHIKYHETIGHAIDAHKSGDVAAAWETFQSMKPLSLELMATMDALNNLIKPH